MEEVKGNRGKCNLIFQKTLKAILKHAPELITAIPM